MYEIGKLLLLLGMLALGWGGALTLLHYRAENPDPKGQLAKWGSISCMIGGFLATSSMFIFISL